MSEDLRWIKSSYSNGNGGQCVEVANTGTAVLVRDSKNPGAGHLSFSTEEWDAFLAGAKAGEFSF